jgi:hypothetical protein
MRIIQQASTIFLRSRPFQNDPDATSYSGEQSIARDYGILEDNKTAFVYQMGCNFLSWRADGALRVTILVLLYHVNARCTR